MSTTEQPAPRPTGDADAAVAELEAAAANVKAAEEALEAAYGRRNAAIRNARSTTPLSVRAIARLARVSPAWAHRMATN